MEALAVSGSDIYAGGFFTTAGGVSANRIAKWDQNSWSALGLGMNDGVSALMVSGTNLYAGGGFTRATNSDGATLTANRVAKWNGSSWSPLGTGMSNPGDPFTWVYDLAVSGDDLYAGGFFTTAGGVSANRIAKWDQSSWTALNSGMNSSVHALAASGSDLYAGGLFTTADGSAAGSIAKWNGSEWSALGSGMDAIVAALAVSGSNMYCGGWFTTAGGSAANYITKWDGTSWSALGSGMNSLVSALAVRGNDLYAGGWFTSVTNSGGGAVTANRVAKWNGISWSALGAGMNDDVTALAVSGNDLYAGGWFTSVTNSGGSAVRANRVAKWNGSSWTNLGLGMDGDVHALAVSDGVLYVGGNFSTAGGTNAAGIAKWNGSSWSPLGSGMGGASLVVNALVVSGSDLYAGGSFTRAGGTNAAGIAKWNGNSWSPLGSGIGGGGDFPTVYALAVSGGDLYAGGFFTTAGGSGASYIAKWNGSSWSALGSGTDSSVFALAVSGSDLLAGGRFTTAGGKVSAYIARAYLERPALSIRRSGSDVTLSWPTFYEGFALQQNPDAANSNTWSNASHPLTTNGATKSATVPITFSNQFFRLSGN